MKARRLLNTFGLLVVMLLVMAKAGMGEERIFLRLDPGGHTAMICDLFFFDHAKKLISASDDKTIRIWDVSDLSHPKLIKSIRGEIGRGLFGMVYAIAVDPKGKFLAVGGYLYDHTNDIRLTTAIRLHDLKTGKVLQVLKGHDDVIFELAFSPDGRYLASGSGDYSVIIWKRDGKRFRFYKRLKGHTKPIYALSFSSDRLASGSDDNTVRLYDLNDDFRLIKVLKDHQDDVCAVSFSPEGRYLVTGSKDKRILLYDKDGNFIEEFSKKETAPASLSFSPDGRSLLAGSYHPTNALKTTCYLYSFPSGEVVQAFKGHKNSVFAVASTIRDGKLILATGGGEAKEILLWDKTGRVLSQIESVGTAIFSVAISSDARKIAFGFKVWPSGHPQKEIPNKWGPLEYLFDLDRMKLKLLKNEKGFLRAMEKRENLSLKLNPYLSNQLGLYYPDSLLDVKRGNKVIARIIRYETDGYLHDCFSFINDRFFVSGGMNGKVFVYNLRGEKVAELVGHEGEVWAVAVDRSGKWVVTSASDQTIRLFYVGDLKDVNWGKGGVDWDRVKKAHPGTYKLWYPHRAELKSLKSQDPTIYRAYVNSLKGDYMPIRKIYPALTIFPSKDGREWVAWTPEGYFTASSPSAFKLIGYHINRGFYKQARWVSFSQLYDQYFRPDLVRLKLARPTEDLSHYTKLAKVKEALETSPPPEVEIIFPRDRKVIGSEFVTVKVRIKDTGGRIGDIRVYVNGKITASEGVYRVAREYPKVMLAKAEALYTSTRGTRLVRRVWKDKKGITVITSKQFVPLSGTVLKTYRLRLALGENIISVQALNGENTILSGPAVVKIKADIPRRPSRLFVLALGVKNFSDPYYNLTYSVSDAKAFLDEIRKRARKFYPQVISRLLVDPAKADLISAILSLRKQMIPSDAFIFYAATHGEVTDDRYWLITKDFTGNLTEKSALTSDEIMELMKRLPAQRQVMILDTCHAGAVGWTFLDLYEGRFTAFSMGSGMHVLSASSSFGFAKEGYKEHGHFTYFVLRALKGDADTNHDRKITVIEMGPWVKKKVEELTHKEQRPVIRNVGRDVVMAGR